METYMETHSKTHFAFEVGAAASSKDEDFRDFETLTAGAAGRRYANASPRVEGRRCLLGHAGQAGNVGGGLWFWKKVESLFLRKPE